MCRSVSISRICRVKKFQNPTVHAYRSYRKEFASATVSKEKDLQKLKSKPLLDEKETEEQMETGRAHQFLQDRRVIEKPEAVTRHSEESQRRIALTCISQTYTVPFFPWIVEGTSFAWGGWPLLSRVVFRQARGQKRISICHSEQTAEKSMEED